MHHPTPSQPNYWYCKHIEGRVSQNEAYPHLCKLAASTKPFLINETTQIQQLHTLNFENCFD